MFPLSVVVVRVDDKKIPLGELIKSLFTEIGDLKKELETLKQANEKLVEEIKGGASL
jgi:cell division protein FtsB